MFFLIRFGIFAVLTATPIWTLLARRQGHLICRQAGPLNVWALVVADVWFLGTGFMDNGWSEAFVVAAFAAGEATGFFGGMSIRFHRRWTRQHRDHATDCEYGPREKRRGSPARLRTWRKVAIRPVFAPT